MSHQAGIHMLPTERHEIALEPHWFRVQTERIKRCNLQAKKDYSKD
ncbi:BQ5605_C003g02010 [Microbotryum silenes-dioicae]|uniref:BQ5605_C003g02010 protein n=1 Tax=Microbotryum silenes-dioicae TaxID=796604 RepID=A0A2X0P329_9BASI|nr:BQ5605_C003g02010 [Microbotryum silenes-dioicae]